MYAHVELRAVTEADLPELFEHQDDSVLRAMSVVPHWPREAFLSRWQDRLTSPETCTRTIWADGQLAGCIMSFPRDGRREVGYILGRAFWGGRIGTRALRLFLSCDVSRPLSAVISKHNVASIKLAQACGFVQTEELAGNESAGERAAVVLTLFA
jgi:RimJ/RimL family protein N-acetyltransferase